MVQQIHLTQRQIEKTQGQQMHFTHSNECMDEPDGSNTSQQI